MNNPRGILFCRNWPVAEGLEPGCPTGVQPYGKKFPNGPLPYGNECLNGLPIRDFITEWDLTCADLMSHGFGVGVPRWGWKPFGK